MNDDEMMQGTSPDNHDQRVNDALSSTLQHAFPMLFANVMYAVQGQANPYVVHKIMVERLGVGPK